MNCFPNEQWGVSLEESAGLPQNFGVSATECVLEIARASGDKDRFMSEHSLVNRNVLALMGGLYRLLKGSPRDTHNIGSQSELTDSGDLFRARAAECADGHFIRTTYSAIVMATGWQRYLNSTILGALLLVGLED